MGYSPWGHTGSDTTEQLSLSFQSPGSHPFPCIYTCIFHVSSVYIYLNVHVVPD